MTEIESDIKEGIPMVVYRVVDDRGRIYMFTAQGLMDVLNDPSSRDRTFEVSTWIMEDGRDES